MNRIMNQNESAMAMILTSFEEFVVDDKRLVFKGNLYRILAEENTKEGNFWIELRNNTFYVKTEPSIGDIKVRLDLSSY